MLRRGTRGMAASPLYFAGREIPTGDAGCGLPGVCEPHSPLAGTARAAGDADRAKQPSRVSFLSSFVRKRSAQFAVRFAQFFRQHTSLANRGHEICVTAPAWHDMQVNVPGHARAGNFADVHAEVESAGVVSCSQVNLRLSG